MRRVTTPTEAFRNKPGRNKVHTIQTENTGVRGVHAVHVRGQKTKYTQLAACIHAFACKLPEGWPFGQCCRRSRRSAALLLLLRSKHFE